MKRLPIATLLVLLPACGLLSGPAKPLPVPHTCYRTTGPLLSPVAREEPKWLMLTDSGGDAVGARWYAGRVVTGRAKPQPVRWQTSGPAAIRVLWGNESGTLEASEQRGILSGTARSGTQSWRVSALREDCPRDA
jgi:hypothetical protein